MLDPTATQLLVLAAVVAVVAVLVLRGSHLPMRLAVVIGGGLVAMSILTAVTWTWQVGARRASNVELIAAVPDMALREQGFVSSDRCRACHPSQYGSWHDSYHRTMTQAATPETVLAREQDVTLVSKGRQYRFQRRGDEFWARMVDPDWEDERLGRGSDPYVARDPPHAWRRIVMTTGSHHMQTYWVASEEDGKLFNFPFTWLIEDQRWVPREDVFMRPASWPPMHGTWHNNCIECHSTAGEMTRDPDTGKFDPRAAELGIACEACHGPAAEHVRVNQDPARRYRYRMEDRPDPTIVNPARLPARESAQVCGQCHSLNIFKGRPMRAGKRYRAGGDLFETRIVLRTSNEKMTERERADWPLLQRHTANESDTFLEERLWPDGMVRVSGRDYAAMVESECFLSGELSCLSCHSMHDSDPAKQMARPMVGDEGCLQCHESYRSGIEEHTHHPPDSSGSRCYNCHMPRTVYGLMSAIRSHLIDSPRVATTIETGRPDACSLCHLDRSLGWTARALEEWYGQPLPDLSAEERSISAGVRWALKGDANQRALIAWHMGWPQAQEASGRDWMAPYLAHLLVDPYSTVRYIAGRSLRSHYNFGDFAYDYIATPPELSDAQDRALRHWMRTKPRTLDRSGAEVLVDGAGRLNMETISRMSLQRNDRVVDLRE